MLGQPKKSKLCVHAACKKEVECYSRTAETEGLVFQGEHPEESQVSTGWETPLAL